MALQSFSIVGRGGWTSAFPQQLIITGQSLDTGCPGAGGGVLCRLSALKWRAVCYKYSPAGEDKRASALEEWDGGGGLESPQQPLQSTPSQVRCPSIMQYGWERLLQDSGGLLFLGELSKRKI